MTASERPVRIGVLRDYPLRLWAEQSEYFEGLLREFSILLIGEQSHRVRSQAPGQLVELAEFVSTRFGGLLHTVNEERRQALERGLDRVDSRLPLVEGLPDLLVQVERVLDETDEYCRQGDLLTLPRSPELVRFAAWTRSELLTQYEGGAPTPWPGPF